MTPVHDAATSYAINFLYETRNCDATGAVNNISSHKWEELGNLFNELAPDVQADLKNATATLSGELVSQAMARYVYILQKYGTVDVYKRQPFIRERTQEIIGRFRANKSGE